LQKHSRTSTVVVVSGVPPLLPLRFFPFFPFLPFFFFFFFAFAPGFPGMTTVVVSTTSHWLVPHCASVWHCCPGSSRQV
jgi:hypothetical protein